MRVLKKNMVGKMIMNMLILVLMVVVSVAFITLFERKFLGYLQIRKGPNKIIISGVFQPLADGVKLFMKENVSNLNLNKVFFLFFSLLAFFLMLMFWMSFMYQNLVLLKYMMIYVLLISGFGVYSIFGMGWSSNSKYSLLGGYRGVAQVVSYEVGLVFLVISFYVFSQSFEISGYRLFIDFGFSLIFGLLMMFFVFFMSVVAELNRAPFDFAESESELVSGFNVEYGGSKFAFIFLGEYGNIIFMGYFISFIFLKNVFLLMFLFLFLMIWVRGAFPRLRYDILMSLNWKIFLPLNLVFLLFQFLWMLYN